MNLIYIAKIVHIVGFTAWFAGLFYLVRMFVYHTEAYDMDEPKRTILTQQFHLMEKRVYSIICNPAMIITWIFGITMIVGYGLEWFKVNYWLHAKLILVMLLSGYTGYCGGLIKNLEHGKTKFTSTQYRLFNEVPTVFLVFIVSVAIYKNATNPLMLILSIVGFAVVLVAFTYLYKRIRTKNTK